MRTFRIPGVGSISILAYTWNRPAKVVFPGGTQRMYGYDALMRLNTLTVTDPGGNLLLDYTYTYDATGNIVTKATEHGEYGYGYDTMSRLLFAENPVLDDESYTYDDVGNRLTSADVSGSWNYNQNNELLGFADVDYEYDDNGNMTEIKVAGSVVWTYVYDAADRLVHVEDGTGTISADYYYDPFGRRLWKDVGGVRTYFCYSDEGLIGEYDVSGNALKTYGYKPDSTWTTDPLFMKQGTEYYFYQNDHLGTPQKLVGVNGEVVWSAIYSSFGEADVQVETIANNLRFPGQYEDAETGLHYNRFRYYNPKIGRYVRTDPIGRRNGKNLFAYVLNNPGKEGDPLGLWVHSHQIVLPQTAVDIVASANVRSADVYDLMLFTPDFLGLEKKFLVSKFKDYKWLLQLIDDPLVQLLQSAESRNGLQLAYIARKNWTGGIPEELKSHNRFVFTCKYGWIDMGHFFQTATLAFWSRVAGIGGTLDHPIAIGGEYIQEFYRRLLNMMGNVHPHGESAFTPEDFLSNERGARFGAEVFQEGPFTDIVGKWRDFLVESGAVVYDKRMKEKLEEDVHAWWENYKTPDKENQEDTSCRYTGPRRHWNTVKCGWDDNFPKSYRELCCCNTRDCPGSCEDTPVNPKYRFNPSPFDNW